MTPRPYPRAVEPIHLVRPAAKPTEPYTAVPSLARLLVAEATGTMRRVQLMTNALSAPTPQFEVACEQLLQIERQVRQAREVLEAMR